MDDLLPPDEAPTWRGDSRRAVEQALTNGVPSEALAFFARWWQFESWLRTLVYIEMRAKWGRRWLRHLPRRASHKLQRDDENRYMPSPDAKNPVAFLDAGEILSLIRTDEIWPLVAPALPPRMRWEGLADELRVLRNRNSHLRRPYMEDLGRIEMALRDLERGARTALEAFNRQHRLWPQDEDPIVASWVRGEHRDARRLIQHALTNYDTDFALLHSRRPWQEDNTGQISGEPGYLFHAQWILRGGGFISPNDLWRDSSLDRGDARELLVFVVHPDEAIVSISFPAVDGEAAVSDAIGAAFDAVLHARSRFATARQRRRWRVDALDLDPRVQLDSAVVLAYEDQPFSVFGA